MISGHSWQIPYLWLNHSLVLVLSLPFKMDDCREDLLWAVSVWTSRAHLVRVLDRDGQWQSGTLYCYGPRVVGSPSFSPLLLSFAFQPSLSHCFHLPPPRPRYSSFYFSNLQSLSPSSSSSSSHAASCLVPLADLLNMARSGEESNTQCGTNENSTHFECYTTQQVGRGTQVGGLTHCVPFSSLTPFLTPSLPPSLKT